MRILITGGAGFIGANLALHLRQALPDAVVACMDNLYRRGSELNVPRLQRAGVLFCHGDVRNLADFPEESFDFVIECSAEPSVLAGQQGAPDYLFHTNLVGLYHCLENVRSWHAKLVFLSSNRVYPVARLAGHPWREEVTRFVWEEFGTPGIGARGVSESLDLSGARSLYGFTKLAAEQLIEEYRAAYGVRAIVNRCGVVAGPWQFGKVEQGVAALWVLAHYFGRPLHYIGYEGSGKQVRDFLHVDDLCGLLVQQLVDFDQWDGWTGNVAGGINNSASLSELTSLCQDISGRDTDITGRATPRQNDLRVLISDCEKLYQRTNWRPRRSVRRIITDLFDWVEENDSLLKHL